MTANNTNEGPSPCEEQCQSQQKALTSCMNAIRDAREMAFQQTKDDSGSDSDSGSGSGGVDDSSDISKVDTTCLAPSIASWTECCSKANNGGVEVNQGHVGI